MVSAVTRPIRTRRTISPLISGQLRAVTSAICMVLTMQVLRPRFDTAYFTTIALMLAIATIRCYSHGGCYILISLVRFHCIVHSYNSCYHRHGCALPLPLLL